MLLQCRNQFATYRIELPPGCKIRRNHHGMDCVVVADPEDPEVPFLLADDILISAAWDGSFGLRLVSFDPLN